MAASAETFVRQEHEDDHFDRSVRTYDNATTWFAEALDGSMRSSFEFQFDGHELYGHDGGALGPIFKKALDDAEKLAETQPNLVFELRRRKIEHGEYQDMLSMARGETSGTMVVVSDFPPELMDAQEDVGGYNVSRKPTMLRVIARQEDGSLKMTSQSLDGSNRSALESIYAKFGRKPEAGELLGQRIHDDVAQDEQPYLIDRLTGQYDRTMATQYGGRWFAGRNPEDFRNTFNFVKQQTDILDFFVESMKRDPINAEKWRYRLAATLSKRFRTGSEPQRAYEFDPDALLCQLRDEIAQASAEARSQGRVFSGCGGTVEASTDQQLNESGYGSKTNESTSYKFDKKMHCVVCQAPPKKDEAPKMCGPCGWCRDCVKRKGYTPGEAN